MLPRPLAQLPASALARLGAVILAVAAVAPGQPLRAAPAVNGAPIANNDSLAAFTDQDFQRLYVLDNDTDPDFDTLTITNVGFAAHGQPVGGPSSGPYFAVDYKPNAGFTGNDSFTYPTDYTDDADGG